MASLIAKENPFLICLLPYLSQTKLNKMARWENIKGELVKCLYE